MNKQNKLIGRVLATEKAPTTMDKFNFWTNSDLKLHAFDIVKVKHIDNSFSFGVIENISHITDAQSFLTNFISSDFGDVDVEGPTSRVGMNYAEAAISFNDKNLYTPVHNDAPVYLATAEEITMALGLDKVQNPLVCGSLKMYEGTADEITLPVNLNSKFILGPEGAHLNISGISGLASKTSYAMFLMKAIQDQYIKADDNSDDSVAFVIFNVKGKDLMAIDRPNDFVGDKPGEKERVLADYETLKLSTEPFKNVLYYIPFSSNTSAKQSTYLSADDVKAYMEYAQLKKIKYSYEDDKESLEMLFADIDDPQQTMEAIISKIIDDTDPDFGGGRIATWQDFRDKVDDLSQRSQPATKGQQRVSNEISVLSWRKFKRIINKATKNDDMFANRPDPSKHECRLADA
ncbi:MAG: ATP-binding protein, partial [Ruminiclostridium sp.]